MNPWRPIELEGHLEARLGHRPLVVLTAGDCPLSVLPVAGGVRVRLDPRFLYAPGAVLDALARHVASPFDLEARACVSSFLAGGKAAESPPDHAAWHDLDAILADLNARFFGGEVTVKIEWSRGTIERRRRSILFGSYFRGPDEPVGTVKIHPALDQEWVPKGFVAFVVHHELLHAVIPTRCIRGRRAFHPPEFRQRERRYPEFHEWRRWEKANLGRFLGKAL